MKGVGRKELCGSFMEDEGYISFGAKGQRAPVTLLHIYVMRWEG